MPVITIQGAKVSKEQSQQLVAAMTKEVSGITNIPEEKFVVLIYEKEPGNVGVGGKMLSDL